MDLVSTKLFAAAGGAGSSADWVLKFSGHACSDMDVDKDTEEVIVNANIWNHTTGADTKLLLIDQEGAVTWQRTIGISDYTYNGVQYGHHGARVSFGETVSGGSSNIYYSFKEDAGQSGSSYLTRTGAHNRYTGNVYWSNNLCIDSSNSSEFFPRSINAEGHTTDGRIILGMQGPSSVQGSYTNTYNMWHFSGAGNYPSGSDFSAFSHYSANGEIIPHNNNVHIGYNPGWNKNSHASVSFGNSFSSSQTQRGVRISITADNANQATKQYVSSNGGINTWHFQLGVNPAKDRIALGAVAQYETPNWPAYVWSCDVTTSSVTLDWQKKLTPSSTISNNPIFSSNNGYWANGVNAAFGPTSEGMVYFMTWWNSNMTTVYGMQASNGGVTGNGQVFVHVDGNGGSSGVNNNQRFMMPVKHLIDNQNNMYVLLNEYVGSTTNGDSYLVKYKLGSGSFAAAHSPEDSSIFGTYDKLIFEPAMSYNFFIGTNNLNRIMEVNAPAAWATQNSNNYIHSANTATSNTANVTTTLL